jgi:hypothetical protein
MIVFIVLVSVSAAESDELTPPRVSLLVNDEKRGLVKILVSTVVAGFPIVDVKLVTPTELEPDRSIVLAEVMDVVSTITFEELSEINGWLLFTL